MSDKKISQLPVGALTPLSIFPIVTDGITSKIAFYDILNQVSEMDKFLTGGTYDNGTTTFTNNKGDVFDVTGYFTGNTDIYITGGTYSGGITTLTNSIGDSFDITGYTIDTKLLITGATNYVAKFDSTGLTESQIIDDGIDVDIANGNFKFEKSGYATSFPLITFGKNVPNSFYMNVTDTGSFQIRRTGSAFGALIRLGSAWGTLSAQTPATQNQSLGGISFEAYTGPGTGVNGFTTAASIGAGASANASTGNSSAHMTFKTTPTGSTTSLERMRITDAGNLLISTTTDNGIDELQINGSAFITSGSSIANINIGRGTNTGNLIYGYSSLGTATTGSLNIAIGDYALTNTTSGHDNTAIGYASLNKNTTGYENVSIGEYAMYFNTTGTYNVALGNGALQGNVSGTQNMSIGGYSLYNLTAGTGNVAIGVSALQRASVGDANVAIGNSALFNCTTGIRNTAIGSLSMYNRLNLPITGNYNVAIGFQSARAISSGSNNIIIDIELNDGVTSGNNNIIIDGVNTCGISTSSNNVVIGGFNSNIPDTGNGMYFGTGNGTMRFQFDSAGTMSITSAPLSGTTADKVLVRTSSGQIRQIDITGITNSISGSGNVIPKFNSNGTGLISSSIYETVSGKIGIGTLATPKDLTFDGSADREITTYKTDFNTSTNSIAITPQPATGDYSLGFLPLDGVGNSNVQACNNNGDMYYTNGNNLFIQPYGTGVITLVSGITTTPTNYCACATVNKATGDVYVALTISDIYKQSGGTGNFVALGQTVKPNAMAVAPNGNVYACDSSDVYIQSGGTGNFVALSANTGGSSITIAPNGDVYVGKAPTGIYKQTGGVGSFVLFSNDTNTTRVTGLATAPNGDIWASCNSSRRMCVLYYGTSAFVAIGNAGNWSRVAVNKNGDVYASFTGGNAILKSGGSAFTNTTIMIPIPSGVKPAIAPNGDIWTTNNSTSVILVKAGTKTPITVPIPNYASAITVAPNGDVYFCINNGDIYKATSGTTNFVALGQTVRQWNGLSYAPNGDIYACTTGAGGDIYKQTGGVGNFVALAKTTHNWTSLSIHPITGDIYATAQDAPYDLWVISGAGQPVRQNLVGLTNHLLGVAVDSYGDVFVTRYQGIGLFKVSGTTMTAVSNIGGNSPDAYYGIGHMNGNLVTASYQYGFLEIRPRKNAGGGIAKIKGGFGFGNGASRVQIITGVKTGDGGILQTDEQVVTQFDENKNATFFGNIIKNGGTSDQFLMADGSVSTAGVSLFSAGTGLNSVVTKNSGNIASGILSFAEGSGNTASNFASHVEGLNNIASGLYSHAEGDSTQATGEDSHAEGNYTIAEGDVSHAEGWTTHAIGFASHTEGNQTQATGEAAHAEGLRSLASGYYSHAEGYKSTAMGTGSHAEGYLTTAFTYPNFFGIHAEGQETFSAGRYGCHAEGYQTVASGDSAHAEGGNTKATGNYSHAEGYYSQATNYYAHAEGFQCFAYGDSSHAEGYFTKAYGYISHSEGQQTIASGTASHAEGQFTTSLGIASHAGGSGSTASGNYSFVHGTGSTASGTHSIVLGSGLIGSGTNITYVNQFNIKTVPTGTSISNLGIDATGNVIIGSTGANSYSNIGLSTSAITINFTTNNIQKLTLTGNTDISFTGMITGYPYRLITTITAETFNYGITFPSTYIFDKGNNPYSFSVLPTIDTVFTNTTDASIQSMTVQTSDSKILLGGDFTTYSGQSKNKIVRLNPDGTIDNSFSIGTGFGSTPNQPVKSIVVQPDGKIILGGNFITYSGQSINRLIRLTSSGTSDPTFNIGTGFNSSVYAIALQPDGKIIVGGAFTQYSGITANSLIRLNPNGSKDTSFNIGTGFNDFVTTLSLQPDGKIIVGGGFGSFSGIAKNCVARLNSDGSNDSTFANGSISNVGSDNVNSIALQPNGKIIFGNYSGISAYIFRLQPNGSLDTSFSTGTNFDNTVNSVLALPNNKVLVVGYFANYNGSPAAGIARLHSDGSFDSTFKMGSGFSAYASTMTQQPDNKVLFGGTMSAFSGTSTNNLIRLNNINYPKVNIIDVVTDGTNIILK